MTPSEGNGDSKGFIHVTETANYALFYPEDVNHLPDNYPSHLSLILAKGMNEHPGIRMRAALPIVQQGQTLYLHLWFDRP